MTGRTSTAKPENRTAVSIEIEELVANLTSFPLGELPGVTGVWSVVGTEFDHARTRHWHGLTALCRRLDMVDRFHDARFEPVQGKIAMLMTALCSYCWEDAHGPDWNLRAQRVMAKFVPSLHGVLTGLPMEGEAIEAMSLPELQSSVRVARNFGRRGVVPHLLALSNIDPITRGQRVRKARMELELAEAFHRRATVDMAASAHSFLSMARFDLYRALGEQLVAAATERPWVLLDEIEALHDCLTNGSGDTPARYRWKAVGFGSLFEHAVGSLPSLGGVAHEVMLQEALHRRDPADRECATIFELNARVARGDRGIEDAVERLLAAPGVLAREKSFLTAATAVKLIGVARDRFPGLAMHLGREYPLAVPSNVDGWGAAFRGITRGRSLPMSASVADMPPMETASAPGHPNAAKKCRIRVDTIREEIWLDGKLISATRPLCQVFAKLVDAGGGLVRLEQLVDRENHGSTRPGSTPSEWLKYTLDSAKKPLRKLVASLSGSSGRYLVNAAFVKATTPGDPPTTSRRPPSLDDRPKAKSRSPRREPGTGSQKKPR